MQTRSSPNIQTLHRLAHQASIDDYQSLSKTVLFSKLQEQFNLDRLVRAEARRSRFLTEDNKKRKANVEEEKSNTSTGVPSVSKKKMKLNTVDPIMFSKIDKRNVYTFTRPNGTEIRFNVGSLVDYMIVSGDFSDPETRLPFSDADLVEIDRTAAKLSMKKPSVLNAKKNMKAYTDAKFRQDALLGLERCAGEVITDILNIVETCDPDEAQMQLVMREFPTFQDYFRQIQETDTAYASKCVAHWRLFMQGPPNRPNEDDSGLIQVVCDFLKRCEDGTA